MNVPGTQLRGVLITARGQYGCFCVNVDHAVGVTGAGTRNGAELLGKLDSFGTIEPGKTADLVLVDGDVVADIARLCAPIRMVTQSGRIVHESSIPAQS